MELNSSDPAAGPSGWTGRRLLDDPDRPGQGQPARGEVEVASVRIRSGKFRGAKR